MKYKNITNNINNLLIFSSVNKQESMEYKIEYKYSYKFKQR